MKQREKRVSLIIVKILFESYFLAEWGGCSLVPKLSLCAHKLYARDQKAEGEPGTFWHVTDEK